MKHKLQRLLSTVLAGCFLLVGNVPLALAQQSGTQGVEINDTQFPDEKFRTYIKENLDKNEDDTRNSTGLPPWTFHKTKSSQRCMRATIS